MWCIPAYVRYGLVWCIPAYVRCGLVWCIPAYVRCSLVWCIPAYVRCGLVWCIPAYVRCSLVWCIPAYVRCSLVWCIPTSDTYVDVVHCNPNYVCMLGFVWLSQLVVRRCGVVYPDLHMLLYPFPHSGLDRWTYWAITYIFNYLLYIMIMAVVVAASFIFQMRLVTQVCMCTVLERN